MNKIFLFIIILSTASCNNEGKVAITKSKFDIESVKSHIIEMNKTYSNRFMTNDTAFYIERYCKDAEVFCPAVPVVKGRDAIRNFFYQNGTNKETKIELPTGNFYGNEELVVEEGSYNFPDGKGGSIDKGKFLAIWKQEDGKWKMYREIWNTDMPVLNDADSVNTNNGEYACIPCGRDCDKASYEKPGTCSHCQMQLVKKSTITFKNVAPQKVCELISENKKTVLLDVRTPEEFNGTAAEKFGRLNNAINIPIQELDKRMSELSKYKNQEIVVYCSHSHRSPQASYLLNQKGFKKVTNMLRGMSVWKEEVKDSDCNKNLYVSQ
jgi:rhodanese-related sulfurtransferase/ketosteroid isomerase-like protein/DNA-directed RNA polymerase subunit RPC12/RpoP